MKIDQVKSVGELWRNMVSVQCTDGYYPNSSLIFDAKDESDGMEYEIEYTIRNEDPVVSRISENFQFEDSSMDDVPSGLDWYVSEDDLKHAFRIERDQITASLRNLKMFKEAVEESTKVNLGEVYVD